MKRNYLIITTIVAVAIFLIAFTLYSNKKQINEKGKGQTTSKILEIPVLTNKVQFFTPTSTLKKTGNVSPFKQSIVYASIAGNVKKLGFELGTRVSAGQLMAIMDPQKINIDLQNAVAKEKKLQNELKTYTELLEGKAATQEKVNQLRLDYTDASSQTAQIRKQLGDTRILAPISGIVTSKAVEQGVYLTGGGEIATIVDLQKVKVQVYLTEAEVHLVKLNSSVAVTNEVFPDRVFNGKISYISPQGDATHSYLTEITVANPDNDLLRSGAFVYAEFNSGKTIPVLSIPREALVENTQTPTVYIIQNNKAISRTIRLGKDYGDKVEVLSGLSQGETLVVSGQINLKDQSVVKITNNKSK